MLINVYAGVFVGDSFSPKGFVLLGGKPVYLRILFENSLEKWGAHFIRVHIITSKYGIPTHNMQKAFQHSLEKRELNWNCHLVFSIILKVFLLLDFIECTTCRREKILPFLMTVVKTAESFQATFVATSVPKPVSVDKQ